MRKFLLLFLFLIILVAAGCQKINKELAFVGEGDIWSGQLIVDQNEGDEAYYIHLAYKGDNLDEVEPFLYNLTSQSGVVDYTDQNAELNEKGIFENNLLGENSPSTNEEDEFEIEIRWNGKSEIFNLK